ncbi:MAG TPA: GIY-YIG nuclease family protein [Sphingomicrobium sp.]|jgi:hypothetical protein
MRKGRVYFVGAPGGEIKIGYSVDLRRRRNELQVGSSKKVQVLASVPGGREEEAAMHLRFRHLHLRGDWFEPGPDLLAYIWQVAGWSAAPSRREAASIDRSVYDFREWSKQRIAASAPENWVQSSLLWRDYLTWCDLMGIAPRFRLTRTGFGRQLGAMGYFPRKDGRGNIRRHGLSFRLDEQYLNSSAKPFVLSEDDGCLSTERFVTPLQKYEFGPLGAG